MHTRSKKRHTSENPLSGACQARAMSQVAMYVCVLLLSSLGNLDWFIWAIVRPRRATSTARRCYSRPAALTCRREPTTADTALQNGSAQWKATKHQKRHPISCKC